MNKKMKYIGIITIVVALIIGSVEAVGYFQSQGVHCSVDPYDAGCFCYEDEVRGQYTEEPGKYKYTCLPSEPSEYYELPIETWEEALQFVDYNFGAGTSQCTCGMNVECEESDMWLYSYRPDIRFAESGPIPEEWMDGPIEFVCEHVTDWHASGMPHSAHLAWQIRFFPRSGNIWERRCNPNYISNCPDNIRPISIINYLRMI